MDAFTVGALIEDLDISDLRERATDTPDIALVYEDLSAAPRTTCARSSGTWTARARTYTPTYISVDEFESILGSSNGQGRSG